MFKGYYEIKGITPELFNEWKKDMREDILVWEKNGVVHAHIILSRIEAIWMQFQMRRFNKKQNSYQLQLVRI